MAYKRKTEDEYAIQQYTGPQYGWEDVCVESTRAEATERRKEYQENQSEYPVRIMKRRIKLKPMEVKYVAQGLFRKWNKMEQYRLEHYPNQPKTPLLYFMRYNYEHRYVKLCLHLEIEPKSFGAWLRKPIESII